MAGQRLSTEHFSRIYCSDLNRTVQTAAQITPFHASTGTFFTFGKLNKDVILDPRLREKSGGVMEGLPVDAFKEEASVLKRDVSYFLIESREEYQE